MGLRDSELGFFSVLPAYAGMIPLQCLIKTNGLRAPRIRGDDPDEYLIMRDIIRVLPAYAGMIPDGCGNCPRG